MKLDNKDEKGRKMFLRLFYWRWVGFGGVFIGTIIVILNAYNSTNRTNGSYGLFDRLAPILAVIIGLVGLLVVISTAVCTYYYIKTAAHLGIKFGLNKSPWAIYREMEQIAKEKNWI